MTHDDGTGPSWEQWSKLANIDWARPGGDWIDAAGTMYGAAPFASAAVSAVGLLSIDLPDVAVMRHGVLLQYAGKSSPSATVAGRLSTTPPVMRVAMSDGSSADLPCLCLAKWDKSTFKAFDTRANAKLSTAGPVCAVFDIPAGAVSGQLLLNVEAKSSYHGAVSAFALRPPGISQPRLSGEPVMGLAATVGNEADLAAHPLVIMATDWADLRVRKDGGVWTGLSISDNADPQQIEDPTAPRGGVVLRARFRDRVEAAEAYGKTVSWADQNCRGGMSATFEMSPASLDDPMRAPANVVPEAYLRVYMMLEDDWKATNDGNKSAIGWDMRYGWWNKSGYWQQTTGNGGSRGSGLKKRIPAGVYSGQDREQWVYEGHSMRMEFGIGPTDQAHQYAAMRPIQSYVYSLDQIDFNGRIVRHGNAMIERGRWHCIEQRVRMNSVRPMNEWDHAWEAQQVADGWLPASRNPSIYTDGFDELGNGGAVADGILQTWLDGVLIDDRQNMRWRRHTEMGVGSPWINWFFGGKQAANREIHFRMGRVVLAQAYIGP